jgi:uncharacterized protein (DUF302 family)
MVTTYAVEHREHASEKRFEELVAAFESAVGDGDDGKFIHAMKQTSNLEEWTALCRSSFGSSGFIHVLTFDHGDWLKFYGTTQRARQYTYGNPLLAYTMIKHDIGACFHVPFRVLIYETPEGKARIAYDVPSSLVASLQNREIDAEATKIDAKVIAFFDQLAGAAAA